MIFVPDFKENRMYGGSGVTCLEHCKSKENQKNPRKFNRAEAPAASATIGNHRKSFKSLSKTNAASSNDLFIKSA